MRPYLVSMTTSSGNMSETKAELIVSSERAARGVVRYFRDRVEYITAEPVQVMTSKQAIEQIESQLGWRPDIDPYFRGLREDGIESDQLWNRDVIR